MDIEFIYDTKSNEHFVATSGEHTALVNFLNHCFGGDDKSNKHLNTFIQELEGGTQAISIFEWQISQDERDEIVIKSNQADTTDLAEDSDLQLMKWELECHCGKQDFLEVLHNWSDFIAAN